MSVSYDLKYLQAQSTPPVSRNKVEILKIYIVVFDNKGKQFADKQEIIAVIANIKEFPEGIQERNILSLQFSDNIH